MSSEGEGEGGKLPSVDHGRRTDRGRDKKGIHTTNFTMTTIPFKIDGGMKAQNKFENWQLYVCMYVCIYLLSL